MKHHGLYKPSSRAHWLVQFLYIQMLIERMTITELATRAGISRTQVYHWWDGSEPSLAKMEFALGVFNFRLKPTGGKP